MKSETTSAILEEKTQTFTSIKLKKIKLSAFQRFDILLII